VLKSMIPRKGQALGLNVRFWPRLCENACSDGLEYAVVAFVS
jgi:hypothetical protein